MGTIFTFICTSCDYKTESSGKEDRGFLSVVKPFICNDCEEVYDILIEEIGKVVDRDFLEVSSSEINKNKESYSCPSCNSNNLTDWNPNDYKCPKCECQMIVDKNAKIKMWD